MYSFLVFIATKKMLQNFRPYTERVSMLILFSDFLFDWTHPSTKERLGQDIVGWDRLKVVANIIENDDKIE